MLLQVAFLFAIRRKREGRSVTRISLCGHLVKGVGSAFSYLQSHSQRLSPAFGEALPRGWESLIPLNGWDGHRL
jgi:hypothetical protein